MKQLEALLVVSAEPVRLVAADVFGAVELLARLRTAAAALETAAGGPLC